MVTVRSLVGTAVRGVAGMGLPKKSTVAVPVTLAKMPCPAAGKEG
jgi:hypothetical protein